MNRDNYAVIDKIEGRVATLLVGEAEDEIVLNLDRLPAGVKEGDWFELDGKGGFVEAPEVTKERKKVVRSKLDRLRGS